MDGRRPSWVGDAASKNPPPEVELDPEALVEEDRRSLLSAAANARGAAMLTGTHGVVAPPLDRPDVALPSPAAVLGDEDTTFTASDGAGAIEELARARLACLMRLAASKDDDPVARLRAGIELAYEAMDAGRDAAALRAVEDAAAGATHALAAHALLRSLREGAPAKQLAHVVHVVEHGEGAMVRADFLAEKARLLEVTGGASSDVVAAYGEALALVPDHAGALAGLEASLDRGAKAPEMAAHLGRLAGLAGEPKASAWFYVERALLLDRVVGDRPAARGALERALQLDGGVGAVRQACVDHAVVHREDAWLAQLLADEAALEVDAARAACLELDGALAFLRGADPAAAITLLERAHARSQATKLVEARVSFELAALFEAAGRYGDLVRVLDASLRSSDDPREQLLVLRRLATAAELAGDLERAIVALESARVLEADDPTLLAELDRLLVRAERHEARAVAWLREAAVAEDPPGKAAALLVAAKAYADAGKGTEAARHREAAWLADPSAPGVFDAIAERAAPPSTREQVAARVALYEQAAQRTRDPGKKLYYREKAAWLWDDVAGEAALAAEAYEDVLALDPFRRSAIAGLASAAERAGDGRRLARALLAEVDLLGREGDLDGAAGAKLRAAESLAEVDPERAVALAESVVTRSTPEESSALARTRSRARALITSLHMTSERWELVARSLADRAAVEPDGPKKLALILAEADVLAHRLAAPERALTRLEIGRQISADDPALAVAAVAALEAIGDAARLGKELERLGESAARPAVRAAFFTRAAEIAERGERDGDAVRLYARAREARPDERLIEERLRRLGARVEVPADVTPPLLAALRALDAPPESGRASGGRAGAAPVSAEDLLAGGARDVATLRLAERIARRAESAPQLANALAIQAEGAGPMLASRALSGLASLVRWSLPKSDELSPWDRLVALGSRDAVVLDELGRRARERARSGDRAAIDLAMEAASRRLEASSDDTERLVSLVEMGRRARAAGRPREAAQALSLALSIDPKSPTAAALLGAVAAELGDRRAAVPAASALAEITASPRARAALLRDAADLAKAQGDTKHAVELLERALESDPDAVLVAARLAHLQADLGAWEELARALRRGLSRATTQEAIVPMAAELAEVARAKLKRPLLAIEALRRSHEVAPKHVPALFALAELYIGQRAWVEALEVLREVTEHATESDEKVIAHAGRANILGRVLGRFDEAEAELRVALRLDPHDARSLRGMLALPARLRLDERAEMLSRLVVARVDRPERLAALLELARLRSELGDHDGAEGALVEAASLAPDGAMLDRLRAATGGDAARTSRVLSRSLSRARESGVTPGPAWAAALGEVELTLGRVDGAVQYLEEALELDPQREATRLLLARALLRKARAEDAVAALLPIFDMPSATSLDATFARLLEESFVKSRCTAQAEVAREVRALGGDLDDLGVAALASRRFEGPTASSLGAARLRGHVLPRGGGHHPIWDVAAIATGVAGKIARVGLAEQGASTRERIKPRAVHPLRQLFDRAARAFELEDVELAVSENVVSPSVACEDAVWLVVPASMADWPEPRALAALARPLARIALGLPWIGGLPVADVFAVLVATARQVAPSFTVAMGERALSLVPEYEPRARRALDRRRRRALEELEDALTQAPTVSVDAVIDVLARAESRASFLLSGDLRASLEALAVTDPTLAEALAAPSRGSLGAVLLRPLSRDLVAFALGADATNLRRAAGTLAGASAM